MLKHVPPGQSAVILATVTDALPPSSTPSGCRRPSDHALKAHIAQLTGLLARVEHKQRRSLIRRPAVPNSDGPTWCGTGGEND